MALLQDLASRSDVPAKVGRDPARERRDIQRAIDLWQQNVSEPGCPPAFGTFDFSPMKGDWAYRFLICSDETAANSAFLIYGSKFAGLLKLPKARLGVVSDRRPCCKREIVFALSYAELITSPIRASVLLLNFTSHLLD